MGTGGNNKGIGFGMGYTARHLIVLHDTFDIKEGSYPPVFGNGSHQLGCQISP